MAAGPTLVQPWSGGGPEGLLQTDRVGVMWKSVFLATGLFGCIVGAELLIIDSASVKPVNGSGPAREVTAPDWAPWALISAGAVTLLHFGTGVAGGDRQPQMPKPQPGKFPHF